MTDQIALATEWASTVRQATANRNRAIVTAYADGASLRRIAEATALSHQTIANIISRQPGTSFKDRHGRERARQDIHAARMGPTPGMRRNH